ncbi:MAG: transcription antitermination factor NusB [Proteobacteria bacterium]|nr:MAG: transcription antitermination factor NusB [Pseudomonadota bacterium]
MGSRRKAREATLQFLFQDDFNDEKGFVEQSLETRFEQFCSLYQISHKARPYAILLLAGICNNRERIDQVVRDCATNWRLERISVTDRNLLRVAVYEMLFGKDVPPRVAINEAVEIAKRFGSGDSPAFVNGVLDAVRKRFEAVQASSC